MDRQNPLPPRLTQTEVMRLINGDPGVLDDDMLIEYLSDIATSYTIGEAFAVIALVDTPDVFD